jgi:ABC-2 type transport system permease protein
MPIYDQGYRRYEARGPLRTLRFWPITREALRLVLSRRAFLGLLAVGWLPFVVRVIQIYIVTRFPEAGRVLPVDGRLFGEYLNTQIGLALFLTIFGGAGLIANDLRTGAILVYLSRPLTRRDYVLGKLSVLLALNASVTLVPALLLYGIGLALAPEQYMTWSLWWIGPAIVLHATLICVSISLLSLAVSSLTKSARIAGLGFFGLFVGLEMARGVLRNIFDVRGATLLSIQADLRGIGSALFGVTPSRFDLVDWPAAALVLLLVAAGCLLLLRSRVRAVEIVR